MKETLAERLDWITVWARLDDAEKIAKGIIAYPDDPRRDGATKILEIVRRVRRAYQRGSAVPAGDMEQLRQLSDAANAQIMGSLIDQASKTRAGFADVADAANRQRHEDAEAQRAAWKSAADEIWSRRPNLTARAVAVQIAKEQGGNPDTIRRKLARPSRP